VILIAISILLAAMFVGFTNDSSWETPKYRIKRNENGQMIKDQHGNWQLTQVGWHSSGKRTRG
jgi:hypothetical protein